MKRKLITFLTAGVVSAAVMTGGLALASSNDSDQAEAQAFFGASQSITAAIGAAETASGGTAIAAEFETDDGAGYYEVETIANGQLYSVEIDAESGDVIETEDEGSLANANDDDIVDPAQLGAPLAQLVAMAEQEGMGNVMSIEFQAEDGETGVIEVELVYADGSMQEFAMAADGSMTQLADDD